MADTTHVKGLSELQKLMDTLPAKVEANIMRGALRRGVNVIMARAKQLVPVSPANSENARLYGGYAGALRDSIKVSTRLKNGKVTGSVKAGGKTKSGADVFYAHMVEFGTAAHGITSRLRRLLTFGGSFFRSVNHPGARPRPFMRPAMDAEAQAAVIAAGEYMKTRLATKQGLDTTHIMIEGDEL